MKIEATMIPHPKKWMKGGEDAFEISSDGTMACVADGVGGWVKKGVDPGIYSKGLVEEFKFIYQNER